MLITWTIKTYVLTTSLLSWIGKSSDDKHDGGGGGDNSSWQLMMMMMQMCDESGRYDYYHEMMIFQLIVL